MRVLFIGDVVGKPGRRALQIFLPILRKDLTPDLVIANGENAAGGNGLTLDTAQEILQAGVDIITSGNHIWDQKDFIPHLDSDLPVLRPLNYPPNLPGKGYLQRGEVVVVNLQGRTFMAPIDCPFRTADALLQRLQGAKIIIVDFHAEATSEKQALGWYLDGRVSAVLGTHTHVPTADPRILPKGTAFITDVGMCGPLHSIIGVEVGEIIQRFLTQTPRRFSVAGGVAVLNAVLVDIDEQTGRARSIVRVDRQER
ncbi:MAG: TIGR00282 family metallophosphoesterase [Dehalococcoidia bacterium]|nr:TIGR00282 family metallophosphoesterase [Dehalococcoidia bacterium]MDW8120317.1 TIGR00282 family metallophosphoesterase [Chloroflexota bacterium]